LILNQLVPLDREGVISALGEYQRIVVVEDHFRGTGLYGMICELCASSRITKDISSRSPENYDFEVGKSNAYFHKKYRFDFESLIADFS
jgi:transketolase C-terminal domain/subunit